MPLGERKLKETEDMKQNKNKTKKTPNIKKALTAHKFVKHNYQMKIFQNTNFRPMVIGT